MTDANSQIALPDPATDTGAEVRILLAECQGPAYKSYSLKAATEAMQLMDAVLWNRRNDPARFNARGAKTLIGIIKAKGQFQGFEQYPEYSSRIKRNLEAEIAIANDPQDPRNSSYAAFIEAAIETAKAPTYLDPSPGTLAAWVTAGSPSPGKVFKFYKQVGGNDFYYLLPARRT